PAHDVRARPRNPSYVSSNPQRGLRRDTVDAARWRRSATSASTRHKGLSYKVGGAPRTACSSAPEGNRKRSDSYAYADEVIGSSASNSRSEAHPSSSPATIAERADPS